MSQHNVSLLMDISSFVENPGFKLDDSTLLVTSNEKFELEKWDAKPKTDKWLDDILSFGRKAVKSKPVRLEDPKTKSKKECLFCMKRFTDEDLEDHMNYHTREKPFSCFTCNKEFSTEISRNGHRHPKQLITDYVSSNVSKQDKDTQSNNKGLKHYECEICHKTLVSKNRWQHIRNHQGVKPFSCQFCKRSFATKVSLESHIWVHIGEKWYDCDMCDESFVTSTHRKYHLRKHTGEFYYCESCDKDWVTLSAYTNHQKHHHVAKLNLPTVQEEKGGQK